MFLPLMDDGMGPLVLTVWIRTFVLLLKIVSIMFCAAFTKSTLDHLISISPKSVLRWVTAIETYHM